LTSSSTGRPGGNYFFLLLLYNITPMRNGAMRRGCRTCCLGCFRWRNYFRISTKRRGTTSESHEDGGEAKPRGGDAEVEGAREEVEGISRAKLISTSQKRC